MARRSRRQRPTPACTRWARSYMESRRAACGRSAAAKSLAAVRAGLIRFEKPGRESVWRGFVRLRRQRRAFRESGFSLRGRLMPEQAFALSIPHGAATGPIIGSLLWTYDFSECFETA